MSSVIVAGDVSGSVTLQAPSAAGSTVITLPSTSGTMALSGGAGSFTTLDASGVATFSAGSVASPAITTTGDTNTGIFFPAADTVATTTSGTERARIASTGRQYFFNAGSATTVADCIFNFAGTFAANRGISLNSTDSATSGEMFYFTTQSTYRGNIVCSAGGTAYNTSSDYRLKNDIAPMTGALNKVALLKPSVWSWKDTGDTSEGFIAHELAEVIPLAVTGEKDAVDSEGNPKYQGVDTSYLVATLTAAIQEQQALIENLTTRLSALENK